MNDCYLEVTYRHGRPLAAYFYLPRRTDDRSCRVQACDHGLLVDFNAQDSPIGIEITDPAQLTLTRLNAVLIQCGRQPVTANELAPLIAA